MAAPRIVSVGSVNIDVQVRAPGWPEPGGAGLATDCLLVGGGKAAYVAYLARRLGVEAQLVARLGDDPMVDRVLAPLRGLGVDLSPVRATTGHLTGVSMILTPPDGSKSILLAPNANRSWDADDPGRVREVVRTTPPGSVVVVDFEISVPVAAAAVEAAHAAGHRVVIDPAPPADVPRHVLPLALGLTPDAKEARQLTGIDTDDEAGLFAAARALCAMGVQTAFVNASDGGCAVVGGEVEAFLEPGPVDVVDATGAGDAFAAGLAVGLLEGRAILDAARQGVAAARVAVTRYGSQASYPDRRELEAHAALVRVRR